MEKRKQRPHPIANIVSAESSEVSWFDVKGVPKGFDKLALYDDDIFLPLESLNLTPAHFLAYMTEKNWTTGQALVAKDNRIFISGMTAISMAEESNNPNVEEFKQCIAMLYDKAVMSDMCKHTVNEKPF